MSTTEEQLNNSRQSIIDAFERDVAGELVKSRYEYIKPDLSLSRWLLVLTGAVSAAVLSQTETVASWLGAGWLLSIVVLLIISGVIGVIAVFLEGRINALVSVLTTLTDILNKVIEHHKNASNEYLKLFQEAGVPATGKFAAPDIVAIVGWLDYPNTWITRKFLKGRYNKTDKSAIYKSLAKTIYHHAILSRLQLLLVVLVFGIALVDIAQQQARFLVAESRKTEQTAQGSAHPLKDPVPKSEPIKRQ